MLSIGSASQKARLVSVLELFQLIPPRCCASPATSPEQQLHRHTPAASFCAHLTALPLLAVVTGIRGHHSCVGGVKKAHRELQFARRRPQTAEIRCSRNALCTTDRQPVSVRILLRCRCWLWPQASGAITAASLVPRRPTGSFSLRGGDRKQPRYVALATLFQRCGYMPFSLNT